MKVKNMWKKTLAGCLSLTLAMSGGMAAFSMEEAAEEPAAAAVEEIRDAAEDTIEEEVLTVEEDIAEEEAVSAEVPALEAAEAQDAVDEEAAVDGLIEDLDTLAAAEDGDDDFVTVTFAGGEGSHSRLLNEVGDPVINEFGDYVYEGEDSFERTVERNQYLYLENYIDYFRKDGYRISGFNGYPAWDGIYVSDDMVLTADWEPVVTVTLVGGEGSAFNRVYADRYSDNYRSNTGTVCSWDMFDSDGMMLWDDFFEKPGSAVDYWYDDNGKKYEINGWHEFEENTVLYAHWSEDVVTITVDLGEGHIYTFYKMPYTELNLDRKFDYEPDGKILAGWQEQDENGDPTENEYGRNSYVYVENNITLKAIWANQVTVTWHMNSGSDSEPEEEILAEGELIDHLCWENTFDENGEEWVADGFCLGSPEGDLYHVGELSAEDGMQLYIHWISPVTLTLKANGGYWNDDPADTADKMITGINPARLYHGDDFECPKRQGKILTGWDFEDGTPAFRFDEDGNSDERYFYESTTLVAVWEDAIVITYDGAGGTTEWYNPDTYEEEIVGRYTNELRKGEYVNLSRDTFEREDYIISGWKVGSTTVNAPWYEFQAVSTITVTAIWAKKVTVTWHTMGGTVVGWGSGDTITEDFAQGEGLPTFSVEKEGYALAGWCTTQAAAEAAAAGNGPVEYERYYDLKATNDMDLYAVLLPAYTVTFDGKGGTYYDGYHDIWVGTRDVAVVQGQNLFTIGAPNFTKTEDGKPMAIEYWSTTDPETEAPVQVNWDDPVTEDRILYAVWGPGAVLTFDLNGGSIWGGDHGYTEITTEEWIMFRMNHYWASIQPPAGKTFVGWSTVKNDPSTILPDYTSQPLFGTGDKTFYALWSAAAGTKLTASDGASYTVGANATVTYNAPKNKTKITKATVPDKVTIGGVTYTVTAIAANAFSGAKKLKTVTIGSNIRTIGAKAFYKTPLLKKVTIKSVRITSIGSKAFQKAGSKSYKKLKITVPKIQKKAYTAMLKKAKLNKKCKVK